PIHFSLALNVNPRSHAALRTRRAWTDCFSVGLLPASIRFPTEYTSFRSQGSSASFSFAQRDSRNQSTLPTDNVSVTLGLSPSGDEDRRSLSSVTPVIDGALKCSSKSSRVGCLTRWTP